MTAARDVHHGGRHREDDWWSQASCATADPALFFLETGTGARMRREEAAAKMVCGSCPVSRQCLRWALTTDQPAGIWGGANVSERRALRRAAQRTRKAGTRSRTAAESHV